MQISIFVKDNLKGAPTWTLESDLNGQATVEDYKYFFRRAQFAIAMEVLDEEQLKGFDKDPRVRTDNKWDKDPQTVRFMGKIEFYSRKNIGQSILEAYQLVVDRSPTVTGLYAASHYVYRNGIKIAEDKMELATWFETKSELVEDRDIFRIVNVTPYAARIEVRGVRRVISGPSKGRNRTFGAAKNRLGNGTYYLSARAINSRYKAQGNIRFEMMPNGFGGLNVEVTKDPYTGKVFRTSYIADSGRRNKRKRFEGPYVYPSIRFQISSEGIL